MLWTFVLLLPIVSYLRVPFIKQDGVYKDHTVPRYGSSMISNVRPDFWVVRDVMKIGILILLFVISNECKKKRPKDKKYLVKSARPAFATAAPAVLNKKTLTEFIQLESAGERDSRPPPLRPAFNPHENKFQLRRDPTNDHGVVVVQREPTAPPPPQPPRPTRGPKRTPVVVVTPPAAGSPPPTRPVSTQCFLAICTDIDGMVVT